MVLPAVLTILATVAFLVLERAVPGRDLPNSPGWYARALSINFAQVLITIAVGVLWRREFGAASFGDLRRMNMPPLEGFAGWFIGRER